MICCKTFLRIAICLISLTAFTLAANGILPGSGTELNPYLIEDINDLEAFIDSDNSAAYWASGIYTRLTNDISLAGHHFNSAPIAPDTSSNDDYQGFSYKGTFDGNGHTISNLEILNSTNDYIGLFGMIDTTATVKNLGLEYLNISTDNIAIHIGGLAAYNSGTISHCCTKGSITADNNAGGLCGTNHSGSITNCYSTVELSTVSSADTLGGFCGYNSNNSLIDKCYFAGTITANDGFHISVNCFCGHNSAYSTISNCFWDSDISIWLNDEGYATPAATIEMQTQSTFTDAGWDFSFSDGNYADWVIYPNSYPQLFWENSIAYSGETTLYKPIGSTDINFSIDIFATTQQLVTWTITCPSESYLIEAVDPKTTASTGPDDITSVTIFCRDINYPEGTYTETLTLSSDIGDSIEIPIELNIYSPVNITDFAIFAQYWLQTGCDLPDAPCADADFCIDGTIDISDLNLLAANWLVIEIPSIKPNPFDGFETGDFSALPWVIDSNAPWTVVTDSSNSGSYSARSGPIPGGVYSSLLQLEIDSDLTNISFAVKTQCPSYFTHFYFYIDDESVEKFSGINDWQTKSYSIEPGEHKFQWFYMNLTPDSDPEKCAWIDDIELY